MRAETLLRITLEIFNDIQDTGVEVLLPRLITAIENQIGSPTEGAQKAVATLREEIAAGLRKSRFNEAPPPEQDLLARLGATPLIGTSLLARIDAIFVENQVTPAMALEHLRHLNDELQSLHKEADKLTDGLLYFKVKADELSPGEFEVAITIPGPAIHDELGQFGRETLKLNQILGVFSEIATGSREPIKMRAVASTDPTFFLESGPAVAALVAAAVERLTVIYSNVLGIIKTHRELKALDVPPQLLDQLKDHIDKSVQAGIEQVAKQIEKDYLARTEAGRKAELKVELRKSLTEVAKRIDRGYGFDVRGEPIEEPKEGEVETPERKGLRKAIGTAAKVVSEARQSFSISKLSRSPFSDCPNRTRISLNGSTSKARREKPQLPMSYLLHLGRITCEG